MNHRTDGSGAMMFTMLIVAVFVILYLIAATAGGIIPAWLPGGG
jgi:hypothetical protein